MGAKKQDLWALKKKFLTHLRESEYAENTVHGYDRDLTALLIFLEGRNEELNKAALVNYKKLLENRLKAASINRQLAAINRFLVFLGLDHMKLKQLRVQEATFSDKGLSCKEMSLLISKAFDTGKCKIAYIMMALSETGVRVSELSFFTVTAAKQGCVRVRNKGTERQVFLSKELQRALLLYCKRMQITNGPIFINRGGEPLSRSYIALEMKKVARKAGIDESKVYPHNMRHYFARTFLDAGCPINDLADHLGHKNLNTTRKYLRSSVEVRIRQMSKISHLPSMAYLKTRLRA